MAKWAPKKVQKMEKKSRYKSIDKTKGPTGLPSRDASNLHPTSGQGVDTTRIDPANALAVKRYGGKQMERQGK